jgi:hypothetical protein
MPMPDSGVQFYCSCNDRDVSRQCILWLWCWRIYCQSCRYWTEVHGQINGYYQYVRSNSWFSWRDIDRHNPRCHKFMGYGFLRHSRRNFFWRSILFDIRKHREAIRLSILWKDKIHFLSWMVYKPLGIILCEL